MGYIHQTCTHCSSWNDLLIPRGGLCPWPTFHAWVTVVRKKWLHVCPYYSTYWCYIHQTCTNCSSWHDLLIQHGGLCPWPTFHAWVTIVRKKWLSLYYNNYRCYINQMCTNFWSWHSLLIQHGGLCFLTFISRLSDHGKEEMVKSILQYLDGIHSPNLHTLFILKWSTDTTWWFVSLTYISRLSDRC